jgi:hypothetical protein
VPRFFNTAGPNNPARLNIKAESITLRNFDQAEVRELYAQHTAETGQVFLPTRWSARLR